MAKATLVAVLETLAELTGAHQGSARNWLTGCLELRTYACRWASDAPSSRSLLDGELDVIGRKKDLLIIGGENIYPQDIEEIVCTHPAIHDGRAIALGVFNPDLGTEDIVVVAEVDKEELLQQADDIERAIRSSVVVNMGVAVRTVILKPRSGS